MGKWEWEVEEVWKRWEKDKEVNRKMGRAFELKVEKEKSSFFIVWGVSLGLGWESFWLGEKGGYNSSSTPEWCHWRSDSPMCALPNMSLSVCYFLGQWAHFFFSLYIYTHCTKTLRWVCFKMETVRVREKSVVSWIMARSKQNSNSKRKKKRQKKYKEKIHFAEHEGRWRHPTFINDVV